MPIWSGSSIAMLVAAQSRNRCGLIDRPRPSRVRAVTRIYVRFRVMGEPLADNHNSPSVGRVHRSRLCPRTTRWQARYVSRGAISGPGQGSSMGSLVLVSAAGIWINH